MSISQVLDTECKVCKHRITRRGMRAVLLGDTKIELVTTDSAPSQETNLVNDPYQTRWAFVAWHLFVLLDIVFWIVSKQILIHLRLLLIIESSYSPLYRYSTFCSCTVHL